MNNYWKRLRFWLFNFYPPYFGAGIRVVEMSPTLNRFVTEMDLTPLNINYVGVHFGGSLYAMADPFYMLILLENLGPDFIVWDKAAKIHFLKPGTGKVRAEFSISDEEIEAIRKAVIVSKKKDCEFVAEIKAMDGTVVARIEKTIYVRKKGKLPIQKSN